MQRTKRLSRRITYAFLFFGALLTLMLGLSMIVALKSIEKSVLDDILYTELMVYKRQDKNTSEQPQSSLSRSTINIYTSTLDQTNNLPEHVRDLPQGIYDVTHDNRDYRILVEDFGNTRYAIQFDDTNIHKRERDFVRLVLLCSIVILLIAFIIGWGMSHRIIHPIRQLAYQIMAFKNKPGESLDLSEFGDDEIGVLARKLQQYHDQLQQLLLREKEFASNVSHELRTPVTSISLAAEVLATKTDLSAIDYARIQRIQRAVGEISELIETFLILAQINNTSIHYNDVCQMEPIVRNVIEQQRIWLGNKPVEVLVEENGPLTVLAHPGILSVLVANLVRNAFRYTKRGSIKVMITSTQLSVLDTGVGIDMATQDQIFKGYVKTNTGDTNRVGLGLAIVQRICERYGWKVFFESKKNYGSKFTVLFHSQDI